MSSIHYIQSGIPNNISFTPFNNPRNVSKMNNNDIYVFMDGNNDKRSNIYGTRGGAVFVYPRSRDVKSWILPITSRAHINTTELIQFEKAFKLLINKELKINNNDDNDDETYPVIHIIFDSQNCVNIFQQKTYPNDDAMMGHTKEWMNHGMI